VDRRAAVVVDRRTWDAGREGTFRRVACRDIRVVGHCTARDNLHLRILAAVGTAVVVLDPDQLAGTVVGNSLVVRDREEDEGLLVLLRGVVLGVGEARVSRAIRLAYCLRRLSLRLRELVFETSHYYSLSTLFPSPRLISSAASLSYTARRTTISLRSSVLKMTLRVTFSATMSATTRTLWYSPGRLISRCLS
jgi:hypothetical protein